MTGFNTTSMRHIGMKRDDIREAVKNRLVIGQQYVMETDRDVDIDGKKKQKLRCVLVSFSRNSAVFKHVGKERTETVTYQDIWRMLLEGAIK